MKGFQKSALIAGVLVLAFKPAFRVNPWLKPLCYTSLGVFLLGFLLWNIDNIFCDTLRYGLVMQPVLWWVIDQLFDAFLSLWGSNVLWAEQVEHPKMENQAVWFCFCCIPEVNECNHLIIWCLRLNRTCNIMSCRGRCHPLLLPWFLTSRASRRHLPAGLGVVTQFHAWWHILTGLGSYLHILLRWKSFWAKYVCVLIQLSSCSLSFSFSLQIRSIHLKHRAKVKVCCVTGRLPTIID